MGPEDPESWYQKAETLIALGQSEAALVAFDRALELNPRLLRVRIGRAVEYLTQGELELARDDAAFVRAANPQDLMAAFVQWRALQGLGQYAEANEALRSLGQGLSNISEETLMREPYLLRLAAWFSLARGDLTRCERYLTRFVSLNPHDANMQFLHGRVLLMLDDPKSAISSLHPLAQRYPRNLTILSALGQAYFKIGHYGEASAMFERAAALEPNDNRLSAYLALSRIGNGNWADAMGGLKETVETEDNALRAGLLLTVLQFKTGERADALVTIKGLISEQPHPQAYNLLGIMEAANGNIAGARQAFEETARLAPDFVPAEYNLAKLELADGDFASATRRLQGLIERNPRSTSALLGLADIALAREDLPAAVGWLEKAVSVVPDNIEAQSSLIELYLKLGRQNDALRAASQFVERKPENAAGLEAIARVQAALGKNEDAIRNFRNAVYYANFNGPLLMSIARQQVSLGDYKEARKTLRKASQSAMDSSGGRVGATEHPFAAV